MSNKWGDEWITPPSVYRALDEEFHFTLDPCGSAESETAPTRFVPPDNGLQMRWSGNVFCNPPYSDILAWVMKGVVSVFTEPAMGLVVFLLPVRTDTDWFKGLWTLHLEGACELRFYRSRIKFKRPSGCELGASSPRFASMLAIIRRAG